MTCDVREAFAHGVDDVVGECGIGDGVDFGIDRATRGEAQGDRCIADGGAQCFGEAEAATSGFGPTELPHAVNDSSLQLGKLQDFGLNVGWNATDKCVESQPRCEDILQGSVVEIAGDALGELDDIHIEEKYVPLLV